MATTASENADRSSSAKAGGTASDRAVDLERQIAQLKVDFEQLAEQLATTRDHGIGTAKRAAAAGADEFIERGEAAVESLLEGAREIEAQLIERVNEKPMTSLAIAAGVGFLFALWSRR